MIALNFEKHGGLIPTVVQDFETGEVLMLAFMNEEAWRETLREGKATYWSRTRQELWVKGKTSGHVQWVREIWIDCDDDTVLLKVNQVGEAACHTGYRSCFFKKVEGDSVRVVGEKIFDPKEVYK
jgi:phosphoribosyl-AMP cyclohydrolase